MEQQQRVEIGGRIRDLREASPETNRSIAEYVGVGERSVANWIAGETGITYEHAKKVAELFDVDVRWLWDGRERGSAPDVLGALSPQSAELVALQDQVAELLGKVAGLEIQLDEALDLLRQQQPEARSASSRG